MPPLNLESRHPAEAVASVKLDGETMRVCHSCDCTRAPRKGWEATNGRCADCAVDDQDAAIARLRAENDRLTVGVEGYGRIIAWMLGEAGKFPEPPPNWTARKYKPWYWWRSKLRERANAVITAVAALAEARR